MRVKNKRRERKRERQRKEESEKQRMHIHFLPYRASSADDEYPNINHGQDKDHHVL